MAITLTTTDVTIEFEDLTEEERGQVMGLCFDITYRQMIEAGEIEEKDGLVFL